MLHWLLSLLSSSSWRYVFHVFFWGSFVYLRHHLLIDADLLVLRLSALVVRPFAICLKLAEHFAAVQWSDWCPDSEGQKHSSRPAWRGETIWIWNTLRIYLCIGNCWKPWRATFASWSQGLNLQGGCSQVILWRGSGRSETGWNHTYVYWSCIGKKTYCISTAYLNIAWANGEIVNWIFITSESFESLNPPRRLH